MNKLVLPTTLFIVFLIFLAPAVLGATPDVCKWRGNISVGGTLTTGNQTGNTTHSVSAYTNSIIETNGTTYDSGTPIYWINVPGNSSYNNITFYVCGIYDSTAGEKTWDCSSGQNTLNLQMTYQISSASCTYDCACNQSANLHCADDYDGTGSWCITTNSCMHDNSSTASGGTITVGSTLYTCTSGAWVSSTITTDGAAGGGGGGGVSETTESISIGTASAGQTLTATYTKSDDLKIQEISVTLKGSVTSAYIQVKESSLPSGANLAIETTAGATYKYLQITKTHMTDDDIESATIKFKVAKGWITGQSIDKSTIALNRYASDSWTKYTGTILSEDSSYIYYTVDVPGLSVFAITGEKVVGVCSANAKTCVGDDLQQCKSDGSAWETLETCTYGCDSTTKACKLAPEPVCTPAEKRCEGNNLQQCKSDASAWETLETCTYGCDATNLVCKSAPAPVCTAGEKKCVGNDLQQCKSDGSAWETLETCTYGCDATAKACKSAAPLDYILIIAAIVIIIIIVAAGLYLRKGPNK